LYRCTVFKGREEGERLFSGKKIMSIDITWPAVSTIFSIMASGNIFVPHTF
jgi:hypothetical protein